MPKVVSKRKSKAGIVAVKGGTRISPTTYSRSIEALLDEFGDHGFTLEPPDEIDLAPEQLWCSVCDKVVPINTNNTLVKAHATLKNQHVRGALHQRCAGAGNKTFFYHDQSVEFCQPITNVEPSPTNPFAIRFT